SAGAERRVEPPDRRGRPRRCRSCHVSGEVSALQLRQVVEDLLRDLEGAAQAAALRMGLEARHLDVEAVAAGRVVGPCRLPLAAQMSAEHAATGERLDDAADAVGRRLAVEAAAAAAPALREDEADLAAGEQSGEAGEDVGDLAARAAA